MDKFDYFKARATVRNYSEKEVSDELIKEIIEAASHAPTTGNMQLYSVVVTRDEEMKNALAPAHFNQGALKNCRVALTFCADFNRFVKWCEQRNADPGYDNFQSFVTALIDTTILAQQFVTIAEMKGLGCCYLGTTTYNAPDIARTLNLPKRVVPVTTITVGWPEASAEVSDRLPVESILHFEKYTDYNADAIDHAYAEKERRDDSQKFIKENNKETLAQVFTDVRYTRANNEYFSKVYKDFIQEQGFEI